ncbi:TolC family protein [Xylophilus sp. Leaf220]|uniref:TolC family protein n=1 Tax=Xylophilus sp. Leaf220 TaxID=1735686 RepID=UPI0007011DCE|nr:TolC family protein [Xylophilus sp. Leaf220]KQM75614.1 hypothetical protein ASE76_06760 [Xylophilus sp. Leaf220]
MRACRAIAAAALATVSLAAFAQPAASGLRGALDAAWALSGDARSQRDRGDEFDARSRAARATFAGPPTVGIGQRSDRLQRNDGRRDLDGEVAVPLWNPGVRDATRRTVEADRTAYEDGVAAARLQLAGELRALVADVALARIAQSTAERRSAQAGVLADDVARRVRAGESARVENLQAEALRRQAAGDVADAQRQVAPLLARWTALTALTEVPPPEDEPAPGSAPGTTGTATGTRTSSPNDGAAAAATLRPPSPGADPRMPMPADEHPALRAALARLRAAQARLALTDADRRDPVEVAVGMGREREAFGDRSKTALSVTLRIPLATENRNAPRQAAARAEFALADAAYDATLRQVAAEVAAARDTLAASERAAAEAAERARLSGEAQALIARAYRLGESSLPDRLRAENEQYEADRALARAQADTLRARAQLRQSLGQLP